MPEKLSDEEIRVELSGTHYQPNGCNKATVTRIFFDKENDRPSIELKYDTGEVDYIPLSELGSSHILGCVTVLNSRYIQGKTISSSQVSDKEQMKKEVAWLDEAREYVFSKKCRLCKGDKLAYIMLLNYSNVECWRDWINDEVSPRDAIEEDLSYA